MERNWNEFAAMLSQLCASYGIGLEGATAYKMEGDDFLFDYFIDDDGKVLRGSATPTTGGEHG